MSKQVLGHKALFANGPALSNSSKETSKSVACVNRHCGCMAQALQAAESAQPFTVVSPALDHLYDKMIMCLDSTGMMPVTAKIRSVLLGPHMQVIPVQLDVGRSRRFPVVVPMHSLRRILATSDAEGLAERVSRALQCRLTYASKNLWRYDNWQQLPPAATIFSCRSDGASLRASLRPQLMVPRLVHLLQQAGWPQEHLHGAEGVCAANSLLQEPCTCPCLTANSNCKDISCGTTILHPGSSSSSCAVPSPGSGPVTSDHATAQPVPPVSAQCMGCCSTCPCRNTGMLPPGLRRVLHLCQHRLGLLHDLQLAQLQHMQGGHPGVGACRAHPSSDRSSSGGCVWQPDLAALQELAPQLPDEATVRQVLASNTNKIVTACS